MAELGGMLEKRETSVGLESVGEKVLPVMRWEGFVGGSGLMNRIKNCV